MALVTGKYVTSTGAPLPPNAVPLVEAVPSKNAVTIRGEAISTRVEPVSPAADGSWSMNLIPTVEVLDAGFHYMLRGYYLVPDGYGSGGYTRHETFEMKLLVPTLGGSIDQLMGGLVAPDVFTIVSLQEPPVVVPGARWLHADPNGDPDLGTGDYYRGVA